MTTELQTTVQQSAQLNIWHDNEKLATIKSIYGKNLSNAEFDIFCEIGKATHLNPFLRELWAIKYGDNPASIFIGRDGYRKSAQAHPNYDYHVVDAVYENDNFKVTNGEVEHSYGLTNRGKLIGAYSSVKRKNSSKSIFVFVELKEYSTGKSLWNPQTGKQATMIKKCAESQCLRMAFQDLFAGTYDEAEEFSMQEKVVNPTVVMERINQSLAPQRAPEVFEQQQPQSATTASYDIQLLLNNISSTETLFALEARFKEYYKIVKADEVDTELLIIAKDMRKEHLEQSQTTEVQ